MGNKIKHLEFIQGVINRLVSDSFRMKGWCVVLIAALFILLAREGQVEFIAVALIPVIAFWGLDGYFLWQERLYRLTHLYHIFYQILLDQQITLIKFREWHYKCVQIEFCRAKSMVVELTGGYNRPTAHYGTTLASPTGNQQVRENFQRRPSQNRQIASRDGKDGLKEQERYGSGS